MTSYAYEGAELEVFQHARRWKAYYASMLRPFISGDVLEVGAGIGGSSRPLCTDGVRTWTSLEPDARHAALLEARYLDEPLPATTRVWTGTVSSIDVHTRFDTVLYVDVLEHIDDDRAELAEASSRIKAGGHLIVLAPAHPRLASAFDEGVGHHRRYTSETLRAVAPATLVPVLVRYIDSVGVLASLANRWFLRATEPSLRQIRWWDRVVVPLSRVLDPLLGHRVGKSIVAIWRATA